MHVNQQQEVVYVPLNIMKAYEKDANGGRRIDVDVHVRRRRWNRPPDDADRGRRTHVIT